MNWERWYTEALPYDAFLDRYAKPVHRDRWQAVAQRVMLTSEQRLLLAGFERRMHLLCVAGAWCGDCVLQGPILRAIADASPVVGLKFADRDAQNDLQDEVALNGGRRVPVVIFLSEDFEECARYGDRTLSTYRRMAHARLGDACPAGILPPPADEVGDVTAEWLREVERVQLMLRLSPRLRAVHAD